MNRIVEPEWLDELPQNDPSAIRSRHDLRRVNFLMGNVGIVERKLTGVFSNEPPKRIVELGAGDGTFMLKLAKRLSNHWGNLDVKMIDRQNVVAAETKQSLAQIGWRVEVIEADVFDWLLTCEPADCVIANLFLHHFEEEKLSLLLRQVAVKTRAFAACEPRRSAMGLIGTRCLWAIGCNSVTRHDAAVSVRAGFRGDELSKLWPQNGGWKIEEGATGLFSHAFVAARISS